MTKYFWRMWYWLFPYKGTSKSKMIQIAGRKYGFEVVIHEVIHLICQEEKRYQGLGWIATDIAINEQLREAGYEMPKGALKWEE
jgi:hypothetical protein